MNTEVSRKKQSIFDTVQLNLKELDGLSAQIGWFPSAKYPDGTPIAYVMSIQEQGYGPIPPRSFFRSTEMEQRNNWISFAASVARQVIKGSSNARAAMNLIAHKVWADVARKIDTITEPPLSPITIEIRAMKKRNPDLKITGAIVGQAAAKVNQPGYQTPNVSTKPLNDTGEARAQLTYVVFSK